MKTGTTDKIEGKFHEAKGAVKEKAGQIMNDPNLKAKGQAEKDAGKVQNKVGDVKKVFNR